MATRTCPTKLLPRLFGNIKAEIVRSTVAAAVHYELGDRQESSVIQAMVLPGRPVLGYIIAITPPHWTRADTVIRSDSQTSSPETRVARDCSIDYGQSSRMDYRATDITLCQVPKRTTLVTVIVRCNNMTPKSSLKPLKIVRGLLGDAGQLIRMTQITSDSWLLVGCQYNEALNPHAIRSSTERSGDYGAWKTDTCSPHGKGANYGAVGSEQDADDGDDHYDNGDESSGCSDSGVGAYEKGRRLHRE
ncbi:hypothetical protein K469DRAFT_684500 [Zopfia rhizophila CBS 207.26]|uniref:Uncharacterized protein n=1 Tax=Zopfia rhizophila CBS 207.26 TaxID=1314779 RepID=A0A6A6ED12_9PEZI|nr:hypothetical protein K469DRAFT_684500 [Zopfia rhizophila CBS 207.26]